jgi:putative membrane protein
MNGYLWIKAGHVIAVVAWFAALFYIFRLYVYHVQQRAEPAVVATLEVMERKLINAIMTPSMVVAVACGVSMLVLNPTLLRAPWMHAKLAAVALLLGYHFYAMYVRKRFLAGDYMLSEKACRILNEVPAILLIIIVVAVIVRP